MINNQQPTEYQADSVEQSQAQSLLNSLKFWQLSTFALGLTLLIIIGAFFYTNSRQPTPQSISQPIPTATIPSSPTATPSLLTVTPTSVDETVSWNKYINSKYKYSLKYSPNPNLKQFICSLNKPFEKGEDIFVLDEIDSTFPECGAGGYSWPISITAQDNSIPCESNESYAAAQSQISISGINTVRCEMKFIREASELGPGLESFVFIVIQHGGKFFNLSLTNKNYSLTFDQVISTFRFLE